MIRYWWCINSKVYPRFQFLWYLIFGGQNNIPHPVLPIVLGIKLGRRITDAAPSFDFWHKLYHYSDVIMGRMVSKMTGVSIVYSMFVHARIKKTHQSSAPLAFVRGVHRWPVNSPHKGSVTRKMITFADVIATTDSSPWAQLKQFHNLRETFSGSSPSVVKHILTLDRAILGPQITWLDMRSDRRFMSATNIR